MTESYVPQLGEIPEGHTPQSTDDFYVGVVGKVVDGRWVETYYYLPKVIDVFVPDTPLGVIEKMKGVDDEDTTFLLNQATGTAIEIGTVDNIDPSATIGNRNIIGAGTKIVAPEEDERPVQTGKNVFMGTKVYILPGVTLEDDVVIGRGSSIYYRAKVKKGSVLESRVRIHPDAVVEENQLVPSRRHVAPGSVYNEFPLERPRRES